MKLHAVCAGVVWAALLLTGCGRGGEDGATAGARNGPATAEAEAMDGPEALPSADGETGAEATNRAVASGTTEGATGGSPAEAGEDAPPAGPDL